MDEEKIEKLKGTIGKVEEKIGVELFIHTIKKEKVKTKEIDEKIAKCERLRDEYTAKIAELELESGKENARYEKIKKDLSKEIEGLHVMKRESKDEKEIANKTEQAAPQSKIIAERKVGANKRYWIDFITVYEEEDAANVKKADEEAAAAAAKKKAAEEAAAAAAEFEDVATIDEIMEIARQRVCDRKDQEEVAAAAAKKKAAEEVAAAAAVAKKKTEEKAAAAGKRKAEEEAAAAAAVAAVAKKKAKRKAAAAAAAAKRKAEEEAAAAAADAERKARLVVYLMLGAFFLGTSVYVVVEYKGGPVAGVIESATSKEYAYVYDSLKNEVKDLKEELKKMKDFILKIKKGSEPPNEIRVPLAEPEEDVENKEKVLEKEDKALSSNNVNEDKVSKSKDVKKEDKVSKSENVEKAEKISIDEDVKREDKASKNKDVGKGVQYLNDAKKVSSSLLDNLKPDTFNARVGKAYELELPLPKIALTDLRGAVEFKPNIVFTAALTYRGGTSITPLSSNETKAGQGRTKLADRVGPVPDQKGDDLEYKFDRDRAVRPAAPTTAHPSLYSRDRVNISRPGHHREARSSPQRGQDLQIKAAPNANPWRPGVLGHLWTGQNRFGLEGMRFPFDAAKRHVFRARVGFTLSSCPDVKLSRSIKINQAQSNSVKLSKAQLSSVKLSSS